MSRVISFHMCSTPFGIIGIFTRVGARAADLKFCVLNAFRHHRNLHAQRIGTNTDSTKLCSTPFGIIGIFTAWVATCVAALIYKSLFRYRTNLAAI